MASPRGQSDHLAAVFEKQLAFYAAVRRARDTIRRRVGELVEEYLHPKPATGESVPAGVGHGTGIQ